MNPRAGRTLLGLSDSTAVDSADVRQAYADRLRAMDPDADPAGFARLREARDAVLADLRRRDSDTPADLPDPFADSDEDAVSPVPAVPWRYAAPSVEHRRPPGAITAQALSAADAPLVQFAGTRAQAPADAPLQIASWPFGIPRLDQADAGDVIADSGRWSALQALLAPASASQPLDDAETARALGHLQAVLRIVDALPIAQTAGAEDSVAGLLAQSWPRSAPLLEPAAAAFGWESERGQLSERPAIAFLNARLRGLRFASAIEQPVHPLHRAWTELSRPGFKRSWWIKQAEVKSLLEGVRKNFPEVERYLDAQRVGAWEQKIYPQAQAQPRGFVGAISENKLMWVIIVFGIRIAIGVFNVPNTPHTSPLFPNGVPLASATASGPDAAAIVLDQAAAHWFGPGTTFADAGRRNPSVAAQAASGAGGTFDQASADNAMRDAVFSGLHRAVPRADHDTLRAIQRLRLQVIDAARRVDPAACYDFLFRNRVVDQVKLGPDVVAAAGQLITAPGVRAVLDAAPSKQALTARIPGAVIDRVVATTGLPVKQVTGALHNEGLNPVQCAVNRALIAESLRLPRATGDPILRVE